MPVEIVVPRLGWSMEEGTFGEWIKASGEYIQKGDMVYVLEGEKAAHEIESFDSGTLHIPPDAPQPGDSVKVGQLIGFLLSEGEAPPKSLESFRARASSPKVQAFHCGDSVVGSNEFNLQDTGTRENEMPAVEKPSRICVTPRARRKANELEVDLSQVLGTGRNGRIRERDILSHAAALTSRSQNRQEPYAPGRYQPVTNNRKAIARRMLAATHEAAPVTLTTKVFAMELVKFRERLKATLGDSSVPSYTDILVKLVAARLPECELLNSCWHTEGIWIYDEINISIAIDTEQGLVAPVIRNVPDCSLNDVAEQSRRLIEQARAGTLSQDQLQGGTFTITNLGMHGIDFFTPILNLPQSAILGIGRIVREPIVQEDAIVPGETLALSLTFDHRVIDGAPAARWLKGLSQLIQQPNALEHL